MSRIKDALKKFADGDFVITIKRKKNPRRRPSTHHEATLKERYVVWHEEKARSFFKGMYISASVFVCLTLIGILLITVSFLPPFGNPSNPVNNEVSELFLFY